MCVCGGATKGGMRMSMYIVASCDFSLLCWQ